MSLEAVHPHTNSGWKKAFFPSSNPKTKARFFFEKKIKKKWNSKQRFNGNRASQSDLRGKSRWKMMCGCVNFDLCREEMLNIWCAEEDNLSSIYWKAVLRRLLLDMCHPGVTSGKTGTNRVPGYGNQEEIFFFKAGKITITRVWKCRPLLPT